MTDTLHRYPGAQPFRDDEISRRTFFGREPASVALADQVLANRLVVVYAKSGMGKTSLLNAGVAPRLREANSVPLFVRVNDTNNGPLHSVLEGIRAGAERQHVEYVHGETDSLWSFFKSVEFWRDDLLLSPVLILDQFEELFTLQSPEQRDKFLSELGYLVRGIPPPGVPQGPSGDSNKAPSVRVVLSLREDFLGLLEEASDRIPQIMDHRFRLAPLDRETAASAITGPAAIHDPGFATQPFRFEPEFVTSILDYLTKSTPGRGPGNRFVEPFQLQLICQRIEKIVALKHQASSQEVVFSFNDFGGEAALAQTLESFYKDAICSVPGRHVQAAVRLLCEEFLISPEGRRLSIEERELQRQVKLPRETLAQLVEGRLLRTDRRSDSTYYELSHDTLVQPVLASRRTQALVVGWASVLGGLLLTVLAAAGIAGMVALIITGLNDRDRDLPAYFIICAFVVPALLCVGAVGIMWLRAGIRRRRRYRHHAPTEIATQLPTLLPFKDRAVGWGALILGSTVLVFWGVLGLLLAVVYGSLSFKHGKFPQWLVWTKGHELFAAWQLMHNRPLVEVTRTVVELCTILVLGSLLLRQGARKLWPHKFPSRPTTSRVPGFDQSPSSVAPVLKILSGGIAFFVAVFGFFTLGRCCSLTHGSLAYWLFWIHGYSALSGPCRTVIRAGWDLGGISAVLFFFTLFVVSVALIRGGVLDMVSLRRRPTITRLLWAKVAVVVYGIMIVGGGYWALSPWRSSPQTQAAMSVPRSATSQLAWAVGESGTILHTANGGASWWPQTGSGQHDLRSVAFVSPQSGWAVGESGTILHTANGGDNWEQQRSGTQKLLWSVVFVSPQSGWTVGGDGTILHTEDGGTSWKAQTSGTSGHLISVAFVSPLSGWTVGSLGTILHTEDGGTSWLPQTSGTTEHLISVAFVSPQSGWAVGFGGTILHTANGGTSWQPQTSGTQQQLWSAVFVSPQSGWAVGDGTILYTEDGGNKWENRTIESKDRTIETTLYLRSVAFATPQSGLVIASGGTMLGTEDGGLTWEELYPGYPYFHPSSVTFAKPPQ